MASYKECFFLAISYNVHYGAISWKFTLLIERPTYFNIYTKTICFQASKAGWSLLVFDQWESREKTLVLGKKTHNREKISPKRKKKFESAASNGEYWYLSWRFDTNCRSVSIRFSSDRLENSHIQLASDFEHFFRAMQARICLFCINSECACADTHYSLRSNSPYYSL